MSERAIEMTNKPAKFSIGFGWVFRNLALRQTALIAVLLVAWELSGAYLFNPFWSSRPSLVFVRIVNMTIDGELWRNVSTTLLEAGLGLGFAALLGIPLGIVLARLQELKKTLEPVIMGLYGLPRVALAPLFILWFGIGLISKVMMSFTMVVFVFMLNVIEGIGTIDQDLLDLMRSMRASRMYQIRRVILPAIVPWILASFRIGVGLSLIGAVVGELIGANRGLGWYIEKSGDQLDTTGVFAGLVILMIIAMLANNLIAFAERKILKWRQ